MIILCPPRIRIIYIPHCYFSVNPLCLNHIPDVDRHIPTNKKIIFAVGMSFIIFFDNIRHYFYILF